MNPDSGEVEAPEEYQAPDISALSSKETWVYQNPSLLKNGRISHLKPEGLEAEEEEKWVKNQNKTDPQEPRLKSIVLDSEKWSIRGVGIEELYRTAGRNPSTVSRGVVGLKSLVWPGWTTVAADGKISSLYVGYGHKYKQKYYPFEPETVLAECPDREEVVMDGEL